MAAIEKRKYATMGRIFSCVYAERNECAWIVREITPFTAVGDSTAVVCIVSERWFS
jgi:hypothetical protein